jgi:hypothetical protein
LVPLLFAVACSDSNNNKTPDAATGGGSDAPSGSDGPSGSTIKVSGVATALSVSGTTAAAYVNVAAYASSDEVNPVATTKADQDGNYTLLVPAGTPLEGFIKATSETTTDPKSMDYVDTYLYPPVPLASDFAGAALNMIPRNLFPILTGIGQVDAGQGIIALEVVESIAVAPPVVISGAKIASTPAAPHYGYTGAGGLPALVDQPADDMGTGSDGRGFLFGLAPGTVVVTATKTGLTFKPTTLKVHADALTTTLITE